MYKKRTKRCILLITLWYLRIQIC
ncbi:unnamed protein product [Larinioides sclopetarius]|uniref:Uncharacterized protein n=1 Tax=Larinioides sclopetarius TaxID=280406 RepID=A0AAV2AXK2_9ARAC